MLRGCGFVADSLDEARGLLGDALKVLCARPRPTRGSIREASAYRQAAFPGIEDGGSGSWRLSGSRGPVCQHGLDLAMNFLPLRDTIAEMRRQQAAGQGKAI